MPPRSIEEPETKGDSFERKEKRDGLVNLFPPPVFAARLLFTSVPAEFPIRSRLPNAYLSPNSLSLSLDDRRAIHHKLSSGNETSLSLSLCLSVSSAGAFSSRSCRNEAGRFGSSIVGAAVNRAIIYYRIVAVICAGRVGD